jgi:hypothetical protein
VKATKIVFATYLVFIALVLVGVFAMGLVGR